MSTESCLKNAMHSFNHSINIINHCSYQTHHKRIPWALRHRQQIYIASSKRLFAMYQFWDRNIRPSRAMWCHHSHRIRLRVEANNYFHIFISMTIAQVQLTNKVIKCRHTNSRSFAHHRLALTPLHRFSIENFDSRQTLLSIESTKRKKPSVQYSDANARPQHAHRLAHAPLISFWIEDLNRRHSVAVFRESAHLPIERKSTTTKRRRRTVIITSKTMLITRRRRKQKTNKKKLTA